MTQKPISQRRLAAISEMRGAMDALGERAVERLSKLAEVRKLEAFPEQAFWEAVGREAHARAEAARPPPNTWHPD